jgi:hypothetical protein
LWKNISESFDFSGSKFATGSTWDLEIENQPYKIELVDTADGLQITNAHPSLLLYIKTNVGDLDYVNLPKLIDLSTSSVDNGDKINEEVVNLQIQFPFQLKNL